MRFPLRLVFVLPWLVAGVGCSCGETHTSADATSGTDAFGLDAPGLDAPVPPNDSPSGLDTPGLDSPIPGPDAPGACLTRGLEEMAIQELRLLDPINPHGGRSFRVQATYTQSDGCHSRAMTRVAIDPATRTVDVTVRDWVTNGTACAEIARPDVRTITLRLEGGRWTIRDGRRGGTATLVIDVDPPIRAPCVPDGGDCLQDCDCLDREICLSGNGLGGPFLSCASPCEADLDCTGTGNRCVSVDDGLDLTCESTSSGCAGAGAECAPGYTCEGARCVASFVLNNTTRHPCTCDSECDLGLSCVTGEGGSRCEVACPTGGAWCSGPHFCAEAEMDISGLAASDAVCGWVGE